MNSRQAKKIFRKLPVNLQEKTPYRQGTINKALHKLGLFFAYYGVTQGKNCHKSIEEEVSS